MSRLEGNNINNPTNDQEDMMLEIMSLLNDTVTPVPDVGNFYTFVYNPKTPNITYDQHPLIACTDIFGWGFPFNGVAELERPMGSNLSSVNLEILSLRAR